MCPYFIAMKGPIACLTSHLSDPFNQNIMHNLGKCVVPTSVDVQGMTLPLSVSVS